MHKSRLGTIVIDCETQDLDEAARFWSAALGRPAHDLADPSDANYRELAGPEEEVQVLVQSVSHPSRVHIDIETDDIEAEVRRHFGNLVFENVVPRSVRVAEAPSHGLPVTHYDRRSRGAEAYWKVAMELVERR